MSPARKPAKKQAARSKGVGPKASAAGTRAGKAASKKTSASRSAGSKKAAASKKTPARKSPRPKKTTAKKTPAKKTTAKKTAAKKTAARKSPPAKKTVSRKAPAKKTSGAGAKGTARKTAGSRAGTKTPPKKTAAKKATPSKTPAKPAASRPSPRSSLARKVTTPPAPKPARPIKLDKKQLRAVKERLLEEKAELERQQSELDADSFVGAQSDVSGEAGLDDDFADAGTATFDRERDLSIRNNITDLIDQITRAVARIDEGSYGTCERCGRPIDAARIKALPHALLCLDCKRREERGR